MDNAKVIPVDNLVDLSKALTLRLHNGLSYQYIANHFNVSKQAIHQALKPFMQMLAYPEQRLAYKANKADLLEGVEMMLVSDLVDSGRREKASLNNTAYATDKIHSMVRLARDQSTSNVMSYHEHHMSTSEIEAKLTELKSLRMGKNG